MDTVGSGTATFRHALPFVYCLSRPPDRSPCKREHRRESINTATVDGPQLWVWDSTELGTFPVFGCICHCSEGRIVTCL
jgi:hypothetical protein